MNGCSYIIASTNLSELNGTVVGDHDCYDAELQTKFDLVNRLTNAGEINVTTLSQSDCGKELR